MPLNSSKSNLTKTVGQKIQRSSPQSPPKQSPVTKMPTKNPEALNKNRMPNNKKSSESRHIPEKTIATAAKSAILKAKDEEVKPRFNAAILQQQIAQLGTEIRLNQQGQEQSKIKFADQIHSHKFVTDQYITELKIKIKQTAEKSSLKEVAEKYLSAALSLDVGINLDGSIYSIRTGKSSGNPVLDDAAKRIVKISAPFPPLPLDMSKELRVLVIPITWHFKDASHMTAR